jgi:hypothetical protein
MAINNQPRPGYRRTGDVEIGVDAVVISAGPCRNDSLAFYGATKPFSLVTTPANAL